MKPNWSIMLVSSIALVGATWVSGSHAAYRIGSSNPPVAAAQTLPANNQSEQAESNSTDQRSTTVGFPKLIFQHKISGSKVVAKPISDRAQVIIVRIVETYPHGSDFRYDIEYKGLEPGTFDVAEYLKRDDGSTQPIPSIEVQVFPLLAKDEVRPYNLPQVKSRFRSYYLPLLLVLGAAWFVGLLMILFYGRGKNKRPSSEQKQLTVADRMRPLIDAAIAGELTTQQQAELERVLSGFWSKKLRLNHLSADELRQKLRQHEEASLMLNQIDSWLHRPANDPANTVDVNELLKPYQTINDDSF